MSIRHLIHEYIGEVLRFGLVGTIAMVIHYGIYYLLQKVIYLNVAFTLGYAISFLFNFFMSSYFTFKVKPSWVRWIKFGMSHGINYLIQIVVFNVSLWLGTPKEFAPIPVYIISIPVSFLLVRFAMIKKSRNEKVRI